MRTRNPIKMKRLNIQIPEELHARIKSEASHRNLTITKYLMSALIEKAQRDKNYE